MYYLEGKFLFIKEWGNDFVRFLWLTIHVLNFDGWLSTCLLTADEKLVVLFHHNNLEKHKKISLV